MNFPKERAAVVFGLFETGLGVARALGRKGIKVIGIDYKKDIAWYSRYVTPLLCPHPLQEEDAFVEWLLQTFRDHPRLPVFFTGDDFLFSFSRHCNRLSERFLFNLPPAEQLDRISDKFAQYQMARAAGVTVPKTWFISCLEELNDLERKLDTWPLFVKGREVNSWRSFFGGSLKGFRVESLEELKERTVPALEENIPVIIQEIIEGPDTNHIEYCAYVSKGGVVVAEFCYRKIRQNPVHFGIGALVESVDDPIVMTEGRKLLKGLDYRGVGNAEFKYDDKDGRLKFIEINTRYWQQCSLAEACGCNFPLANYLDLLNLHEPLPAHSCRSGIKWVNIYMDLDSFLELKKTEGLTFSQWLKSLKGPKVFSDFAADDMLPGFWEIRFGARLLRLPRYIWSKITRRKKSKEPEGALAALPR